MENCGWKKVSTVANWFNLSSMIRAKMNLMSSRMQLVAANQ